MAHQELIAHLRKLADPKIAELSQRFFKTAQGQYAHGDIFLGIRIPVIRKAVKHFQGTSLVEIKRLLKSEYHEVRLFSLLLLVRQFSKGDERLREKIYHLYLNNTKFINNWDLVDNSAHYIVGMWLIDKDRAVLYELAQSKLLWERRIAIMATFYFIKNHQFDDTRKLSRILINDPEDLIHKAVGWMLRETGNHSAELWISNDSHYAQALSIIGNEIFNDTDKDAWICGNRAEQNHGNFEICWKCRSEAASS